VGASQHRPGLSDHELVSAFDNAPSGIAVLTTDGIITACNPAIAHLLGSDPDHLIGRTLFDVTHPDDLEGARRKCALIRAGRTRVVRHECRFHTLDDRVIWVAVSTSWVAETADRPAHLIMHVDDVTDRKRMEAELSHRALHDPLTGLANRTLLTERIHAAVARRGRHAHPSHVFYLDLDGFKTVNDRLGHAAGDAVLAELARRIVGVIRADDTAARLGGDEFAVLCEEADPRRAASIAERLRAAAAEPFLVDDVPIRLSAAVGGCPAVLPDAAAVLREADRRMYETKRRTVIPQPRGTVDHQPQVPGPPLNGPTTSSVIHPP
jgi:diguanylate cyclase (GGDEF)-like protein/PAS domain S-box-containing protein